MVKQLQFKSTYFEKISIDHEIIAILKSAFASVDPVNAVINALQLHGSTIEIADITIPLLSDGRIIVWGVGKASQTMAIGLQTVIKENITNGAVITKHSLKELETQLLPGIITFEGDHPIPTEKSRFAAESALKRIGKLNNRDLVISLISGGGSSLAVLPQQGISLADYQIMTKLLLDCGATIQEINTIRKQLDRIKGGGLAKLLYPARIVSLILSDVVGDPLDVIASGPTVPVTQTIQDTLLVIEKYGLNPKLPVNVRLFLESRKNKRTKDGAHDECENWDQPIDNILIGNNLIAANAAKEAAKDLGFHAEVVSTNLQGEAREVGTRLGMELMEKIEKHQKKSCWVYGGETTVTIQGNGKGGRNQELILSAAQTIAGLQGGCILSIATDGEDGPTDAAGAIADGSTLDMGRKLGLDAKRYLENNDAYSYLDSVGGLIRTGPSGTNVNDLVFLFTY
ncbi:MAG: glycerate kinase [Anaerolineaceae bacterium]|jgi:hydroxypyruvate reductase|nr:MAG: glycerate kinase [Anaerolineaceae bacterium]